MNRRQFLLSLMTSSVALLATETSRANLFGNDQVAFNKESYKYHKLNCKWAIKCTRQCIYISRKDAIARGGVPCKVCGG